MSHGIFHILRIVWIDHPLTGKVEIAGICRQPDGLWMHQMARNLLDVVDGFLRGKRYLIVDRDPLYTSEFRQALERAAITVLRLPPRSPNLKIRVLAVLTT